MDASSLPEPELPEGQRDEAGSSDSPFGNLYRIGERAWVSDAMMDMLLSMEPSEAAALTAKMMALTDLALGPRPDETDQPDTTSDTDD